VGAGDFDVAVGIGFFDLAARLVAATAQIA
jgi:hypothetical protein